MKEDASKQNRIVRETTRISRSATMIPPPPETRVQKPDGGLSDHELEFIECLKTTCYWTQLTVGPHMAEKFYQHMLIANLKASGHENIVYEDVFSYKFEDMNGKVVRIGHGMNARTDVELPDLKILLELKSSNTPTKAEHIAQCRNYLIHRTDLNMGIVINFISKETAESCPYVQLDVIVKTGKSIQIAGTTFELPQFIQYPPIYTKLQPCLSEYVVKEEW